MTLDNTLWTAWWHDADIVVRSVFVLLITLSLVSWSLIIYKSRQFRRFKRQEQACSDWIVQAPEIGAIQSQISPRQPFSFVLREVDSVTGHATTHSPELLERQLGHIVHEYQLKLESGLTLLATVGNSAPFIGLFGTVWGIMHALHALGNDTALALQAIAGPVSEALVATAAGIFTAVPAVMGYNLLVRRLRNLAAIMEGNAMRLLIRLYEERAEIPDPDQADGKRVPTTSLRSMHGRHS
jgi:biopolymer transport protein ExbB